MHLSLIPSTHIDKAWKDGAHLLSESCAKSGGEITGDQLKMILARGEMMLFAGVAEDRPVGWCAASFINLPNLRALEVNQLWAKGAMHDAFFEQLSAFAREQGCSEVRCSAQPAQARLYESRFGFEPVYQVLRKPL